MIKSLSILTFREVIMQYTRVLIVLTIATWLLVSCSGNTGNSLAPSVSPSPDFTAKAADAIPSSAFVMGIWDVYIDTETAKAEIQPLRHASFTGNQNFHAPPGMIKLENIIIDYDTGEIDADIGLEHKFPALKRYTGFDVMGVFMGDGNATYPGDYDLAIHGPNDQRLLNADGYTRWFNANEFKGVGEIPPMFSYNPGHMGTPGYKPTADLNGYKYYAEGLGLDEDEFQFLIANSDDRAMFVEGDLVWRHFSMVFPELPQTNEAKFQYAIIGHWEPNKHEPGPPVEIPDDFPPEANVDEAVVCDIQDSSTAWWDNSNFGGDVILDISPWDWSATCDAGTMGEYVILVYSDAWTGPYEVDITCLGLTDFYETFHAEIPVETLDSCDPLTVWVEIRYPLMDYSNKFGSPNYADGELAGYFLVEIPISCDAPMSIEVLTPNGGEEWAPGTDQQISWDSKNVDGTVFIEYSTDNFVSDINLIAADVANNGLYTWNDLPCDISDSVRIRITSTYYPYVFDTSDDNFSIVEAGWAVSWGTPQDDRGSRIATDSNDNTYVTGFTAGDAFLSKHDRCGTLMWQLTWGGSNSDGGADVTVDQFGYPLVVGYFRGTVDFDPGTGIDNHTSNGGWDVFLSKFDSSGDFQWARTWGGPSNDEGGGIALDTIGSIYVTGNYHNSVDFDPGSGLDNHTSNGDYDVFLSKFDSSGGFQWARTWGGALIDMSHGVATDSQNDLHIIGTFEVTVDFNPGSGIENHTSNGGYDIFLSSFDYSGIFGSALTWGGSGPDYGEAVSVDYSDAVCAVGRFVNTVDFDPGPGTDYHTENGWWDIFISKFSPTGAFQWVRTWGGTNSDNGLGVKADPSGNIFVTGSYMGTVDFDPGTGTENHSSNGSGDAFISKLSGTGDFNWVQTWGGSAWDEGFGLVLDSAGNSYVTGLFSTVVDFAPVSPPCNNDPDIHSSSGGFEIFITKHMPDGCW